MTTSQRPVHGSIRDNAATLRIALCRALLNKPRVLLADEPTGNLDPVTTDLVVTALQEHARSGAAVIVVTHTPHVAEACDREIRL